MENMPISFIGGGVMAEALIKGIVNSGVSKPKDIIVSEPLEERCSYLKSEYGIRTVNKNRDLIDYGGLLLLSVKPQTLPKIYSELSGAIKPDRSVVSIAAGVTSDNICRGLSHTSIIRVMPNTPAQIGEGISVWTASDEVSASDKILVEDMLNTLGENYYVEDEKLVDMATALSASGPAYVFLFLESLIEAGVYLGMNRTMARTLAIKTIQGSVELVKSSGKHPAELKDMVTSPGGTTIEALVSLENDGFRPAVINGVRAAFERSREMGIE